MTGKYRIIIQNKKIKYDFEIRRNITVIRGDSATGKTTLVDMIREYYENGSDSGIELHCEKNCAVLEGRNWENELNNFDNSILFIDEGNAFVSSKEFASVIQHTNNYYVIVTRESLSTLPYSVNEIYGIRNSGKYGLLKQTYNEFYQIYRNNTDNLPFHPMQVITEDSNAGYDFFTSISAENGISCVSAKGKSNIFKLLQKKTCESVLIVADGAAFGSEMDKIMQFIQNQQGIYLYLPESFEWLILSSGVVEAQDIFKILEQPHQYIDSSKYFSWERYFATLLVEKTPNTYLAYSKSKLNPAYTAKTITTKILLQIHEVDFHK